MSKPQNRGEADRVQTNTPESLGRERDPAYPESPAKVPNDADEARAIPTDIVKRRPGEPDAFAQAPAAAPTMTDEESGLSGAPEGRIQPLSKPQD